MPGVVSLSSVSAAYEDRVVLDHIDFAVGEGEFVGIVGPSGSGKTTLLRVILGLVPARSGKVIVEGIDVHQRRPAVGYVPQVATIDWNFPVTVEEVVLMGRSVSSGPWPWARRRDREDARDLLDRLGIGDQRHKQISKLSGGQQQRVFLARALIRNPKVLLLDEPTSGVDITTRDEVLHVLVDLNRQGVTIILSTHELNAVATHLPRVVCINKVVVADGPPETVFTADVLRRTYGGEMIVVQQGGRPLVADSPHVFDDLGRPLAAAAPKEQVR